jgi:hypothetical protein
VQAEPEETAIFFNAYERENKRCQIERDYKQARTTYHEQRLSFYISETKVQISAIALICITV